MTITVAHDGSDDVGYVSTLRRRGNVVWAAGGHWGKPVLMTSESGASFRRRKLPTEVTGLRDVLPLGDAHALVVGEHGAIYETKDLETWRKVETGTDVCLFAIERAFGSIWVAGDKAFVLTSADGVAWRKPGFGDSDELRRVQRLVHAVGALWIMSFAGRLGVVRDDKLEVHELAEHALTGLAFSPRGVALLVGDHGTTLRSTNRGRTWTPVESGTTKDLEDVLWHDGLFVVPGDGGTLLVSEDGASFRAVDTRHDDHLWCGLGTDGGVLVGAHRGLILRVGREDLGGTARVAPSAALHTTGARTVERVVYTHKTIFVRIDGSVRRIQGSDALRVPLATAVGRSHDRAHVAFVLDERIEVRTTIDAAAHTVLDVPRAVGTIETLDVLPGGERLLVASERGVWLLSARGTELLVETQTVVPAALSPDGRFIACQSRLFEAESAGFTLVAEIPASRAVFHDTEPHVCLCAESRTVGIDLRTFDKRRKKPLVLEGDPLDAEHTMIAGISQGDGYLLAGGDDGTIWYLHGAQLERAGRVGGVSTMEAGANDHVLVGTQAGLLVELDKGGHEVRRWGL
jgi:photosystem II stability/assembly factor-like uncharacterized protein